MRVFDGDEKAIKDLMKRTGILQVYAEWVLKGVFSEADGIKKSSEFYKKYATKAKYGRKDEDLSIEEYYTDTIKGEKEKEENEAP
ncbi:MAG: hypothetical protein A2149_08900 [Candidatus Schekmanbacteria bacterium RBG_16_38_11]|uniref:Uncharacterized protein n=2 Tax=Candidatus Schekmaniibacteriota TaxID=1817811 RepID=A0A1F7RLY2_9BACT|nr:MAG: hypothetical protein A2042_02060 [Candidatus Schekmanbacteria bacterium GWA2_38_11]OGL47579.1 MAG: hypothetical protein A2149_08900 [Candidatus Schekmanbacteria bacterium RBG_16_38_11]